MKLAVLDALIAGPGAGEELASEREFRRATRSILKGVALIREVFLNNPALREICEHRRLGFIVSTSVGEIEITRDFLKDLSVHQTARPFLFQLSSHNSTAGFLAQHFSLKGPTLTVSNQYQSAESAIESADLLLSSDLCDAVLVFCVEQTIEDWMDLKMYAQYSQLIASSGASLLLLAHKELRGFQVKSHLSELEFGQRTSRSPEAGAFYDSDTLEHIARNVIKKNSGSFQLTRPDQTLTEFTLNGS